MSKLVSKWASEEELRPPSEPKAIQSGKQAFREAGTDVARKRDEQGKKSTKAITVEKNEPLVSKWATAEPSEARRDSKLPGKGGAPSPHVFKNKQNRGARGNQSTVNEQLPSPPNTAEKQLGLANRRGLYSEKTPGRQRSPRKSRRDRLRKPSKPFHEDLDDEDGSENGMSEAGLSFAARLGLTSAGVSLGNREKNSASYAHKTSAAQDSAGDGDGWSDVENSGEDVDDVENLFHDDTDSESERPPMTDAAKSLASRLGLVSVEDTSPVQTKQRANSASDQAHQRRPKRTPKTQKAPKKDLEKEVKEESSKSLPKNDEKLNEEIKDLFSKLTDKSANWADLVDE